MTETLFCLTNDDAGSQQPELFRELLDFLSEQRVPATFFVVPASGGIPLDEKPEWVDLLHRALDEGHELQHHGYNHGDDVITPNTDRAVFFPDQASDEAYNQPDDDHSND